MPTCVGVGCKRFSQDASLNRERSTHNVRSANMADPTATVAVYNTGRMLLLCVLVWGYCVAGCVGVIYRPAAFSRTPVSTDSLRIITQISDNEVGNGKFSPSSARLVEAFLWADKRLDRKSSRLGHRNHDRESSLKKLLENLTNLQQRKVTERSHEDSQSASDTHTDLASRDEVIDDLSLGMLFPQTQYQYEPGDSLSSLRNTPIEPGELQVVSQIDMMESSPHESHAQPPYTDQETKTHRQSYTKNIFSPIDKTVTVLNSDMLTGLTAYTDAADTNKRIPEQIQSEVTKDINDEKLKRLSAVYQEKYTKRYFIVGDNLVTSTSGNGTLSVKDAEYHDNNDDSDNSEDIPVKGVKLAAEAGSTDRHSHTSYSTDTTGESVRYTNQALLVDSLIQKTVKKMEGIINKRVSQYNDEFDSDSTKTPQEIVLTHRDTNTDNVHSRTYISASLEKAGSISHMASDDEAENDNKDKKRFSKTKLQYEHVNDVTAAVMKAVAARTVPRDAQFWMNVSSYLDSNDYLSRTRRSPNRSRKRNGPQYVHLSITYGHVMPCEYKDRFYCMNGGTCVFVGALDIKTCRCPIGYTGVRCEMIDQEYILSLLTNTLIFS